MFKIFIRSAVTDISLEDEEEDVDVVLKGSFLSKNGLYLLGRFRAIKAGIPLIFILTK